MNGSVTFEFPLVRPHCGVPLANGDFGVLIWGRETLCVTVNESGLWDHRAGRLIDGRDRYADLVAYAKAHGCDRGLSAMMHRDASVTGAPHRLAAGRFEFRFVPGVVPREAKLDYRTGCLHVTLSDGTELTLVVVMKHNILYVEDPACRIDAVTAVPASDIPAVEKFNASCGVPPYEKLPDGWRIALPGDPPYTVRCVKTDYGWKIFSNDACDDSAREAEKAFTARWWEHVFASAARVTTPDPWWNRFYDFCLYKLAAATAP